MAEYVPYVTQEGDRWDLVSYRHYGTPYDYERIIAANPTAPIRPALPAGIRLAIPVIDRTRTLAAPLPPWKR
jgi:phage tail protein X